MNLRLTALALFLCTTTALAAPIDKSDVPEPLRPWIPWVLHDQATQFCPPAHDDAARRLCNWPSALSLDLNAEGGRFELRASVLAPGWISLPGDGPRWPQDVTVDGRAAAVLQPNGFPALWLERGEHRVQGRFTWDALPESLRVPPESGLIELTLSGTSVPHPQRNEQHQLWLGRRAVAADEQPERLSLRVFRLIDDAIPLEVITRIEIDAGGVVREEVIGPALLAGLVPLSLYGDLPARLEDDGRLRVQVRPGSWSITLTARSKAPLNELLAPAQQTQWAAQEIWSLQAHPELRVIEPDGLPAIDPRQSGVPGEWHSLPAFLVDPAARLTLKEIQRGTTDVPPDQLQLTRQLWLDFDGGGFTVQDQLRGALSRHSRLETQAPIALGQVQIDGAPQLITQHGEGTGVEVRNARLNLSADSRIADGVRRIPASGWNADVQGIETTLHLPPAWRLLAAPGVDNVPDTWLSRWSLLDLFLVLIASIAALRLFGRATAVLTLLTLGLSWHEPGAPQWTWLNLVAAIALLRGLPVSFDGSGRLRKLLVGYQWIAAAVLVYVALPFAVQQARVSLYPQLENESAFRAPGISTPRILDSSAPQETAAMAVEADAMMAPQADSDGDGLPDDLAERERYQRSAKVLSWSTPIDKPHRSIQKLDPNVLTQTGPGLPDWTWRQARLSWSGPVTAEQNFRLWLMPPILTRLLGWVSIALIALLALRWLRGAPRLPKLSSGLAAVSVLLTALALAWLAIAPTPAQAQAQDPSPPTSEILEQLRARLTAPPDCLPTCASWSRMELRVENQRLALRLTAEAQIDTALPLPVPPLSGGQNRVWQPQQVLVGDAGAELLRDSSGTLWLRVPAGRSTVLLSGDLSGFSQLQLPLVPAPRQVQIAAPGWRVSGVDAQGSPGSALDLIREQSDAGTTGEGETQAFAPLLRVTRRLQLGQVWRVDSSLHRVGNTEGAYVATLAALPGEVVTGDSVRRVGQQIQVSFAPGQSQIDWSSSLQTQEKLALKASDSRDLIEVWHFAVSPLWRVEFDGLPPVRQQGEWPPSSFQPWPGESLNVRIARPAAVKGQVLTLDRADFSVQPGKRATDYTLNLILRASQGGQHALSLPANLELQGLEIDGESQPARREGERVILPLHPGTQNIQLRLRADQGIAAFTKTPALQPGLPGVNARISMQVPEDRWVLLAGGPSLGPAVQFWSLLAVLVLVAVALGRSTLTPLKTAQWALLMIGLSQLPVWGAALVAGWLFALALRGRMPPDWSARHFNLVQILLALWTLLALATLFGAVAQGLLGEPDMQIAGNGSTSTQLQWYQDRYATHLPSTWVISVSIWFYRGLMLLWALWLANSLLNWLRWGWTQFASQGLWKKNPDLTPTAGSALMDNAATAQPELAKS